jgi:LPXTG-motif cell wall-anchored protein
MDTINAQTWFMLGGVLLVALIGIGAWFFFKKKQSHRLQLRFGTEYGRTVTDLRSRTKAESDLKEREKRAERFHIVPLAPAEAARFVQAWKSLQGSFIDNPKGVLLQADQLVRELMLLRGYPMGDFERRAADISVDHPTAVKNYRAAQRIVLRDERGEASTEELREAVVHFRALFNEMLEITDVKKELIRPREVELQT